MARINDRRMPRSDRVADLQTVARWLAKAPSDGAAHRLWRAAFKLAPARHLRVDTETLEAREQKPVPAQKSWLTADPLWISPRARRSGRQVARGPARGVIDGSKEKALLALLARDEAEQIAEAQRRLATGNRMRLSEIGRLETAAELELFLDLLGEALALKIRDDETAVAHSSDGALRITLEPAGDSSEAIIETENGDLCGDDHDVTIASAFGVPMPDEPRPVVFGATA